jgi:murein DD-endopeptidase MepM/ murein hydrolase activator NlpD
MVMELNKGRKITALLIVITISISNFCLSNVFAQIWTKPLSQMIISSNNYAAYGQVASGKYHAGIDLNDGSVASDYASQRTAVVRAAYDGTVYKIFGLYFSGNNLRRWNQSTNAYTWTQSPVAYNQPGGDNHGFGICVIIYHPSQNLYTLYGHLDAVVSTLNVNQSVKAGDIIGKLGNSSKQFLRKCLSTTSHNHQSLCINTAPDASASYITITSAEDGGMDPHLHFEVKDRGVLSVFRTDDESSTKLNQPGELPWGWGYTKGSLGGDFLGHPNYFGFHDPTIFFNNSVEYLTTPITLEIKELPLLNVRAYPSTSAPENSNTDIITKLDFGPNNRLPGYVARRKIGNSWYQIYLPTKDEEGWSGMGWIAGTLDKQYSQIKNLSFLKITATSASLFSQSNSSSTIFGYVYGQNASDQQCFVFFETSSGFYRIYTPQKVGSNYGWVIGSSVQIMQTVNVVENEFNSYTPVKYLLSQNYPNPFNPSTSISYELPKSTHIILTIYNSLGQTVKTLVNSQQAAGKYTITWDGTNEISIPVAGGVYIYQIISGEFRESKKMVLLR